MIWGRHTEANGMKVKVKVAQFCLILCDPMGCSLPGSSVHGFPRQEYYSGLPFPSPGDFPDPGIEPGLLPRRQILHHLSHQGSSCKYLYKRESKQFFIEL